MINRFVIAFLAFLLISGIVVLNQRREIKIFLSTLGQKWTKLHPDVQARALGVLRDANNEPLFRDSGLGVGIFSGWRSISAQNREIADGDTALNNALRSYHVWGLAVDFVFLDANGSWTWLDKETDAKHGGNARDNPKWQRLGEIIKKWGFQWGGDFQSLFDGPHAQRRLQSTSELIAQFQEPESFFQSRTFTGVA